MRKSVPLKYNLNEEYSLLDCPESGNIINEILYDLKKSNTCSTSVQRVFNERSTTVQRVFNEKRLTYRWLI